MKLIRLLAVAAALALANVIQPLPVAADPPGPQCSPGQEFNCRQQQQEEIQQAHTDASGKVRPDLELKAVKAIKGMKRVTALPYGAAGTGAPTAYKGNGRKPGSRRLHALTPNSVVGVQWQQIGPAPIRVNPVSSVDGKGPVSGQVTDIAIDPRGTTDSVIYTATNDGGIWKSTDGGTSWAPKTDFMPSLSMDAVALDPTNPAVVYAGTGDAQDGAGRYCCLGAPNLKAIGIYKSIDGGDTWSILNPGTFTQPTGIFTGNGIYRILALSNNVLLAATSQGLYRSVDGGQNFGANAPAFNDGNPLIAGETTDVRLDTSAAGTVYASVFGQGIYRSTDSGQTFASWFSPPGGFPLGRVAIDQAAPPNNATVYVAAEDDTSNNCNARVYRSTDTGANFTQQAASGIGGCQGNYDFTLGVDPQDTTRVYVGMVDFWGSTDSGASFSNLGDSDSHDDNHALAFSPKSHWTAAPTHLFIGTDGGLSAAVNGGAASSDWTNLNEGVATSLVFNMDMGRGSAANNGYTYNADQDTGLPSHKPARDSGNDWTLATGGDGGPIVVDPTNGAHAYGAYNAQLVITNDGGSSWSTASATGLPHSGCCGLVSLLAIDPNNGANVYATNGLGLYLSTDSASNFTLMKAFTLGPSVFTNHTIDRLATVSSDSNTLWACLGDGTVWSTTNALSGASSTWTSHTVNGAPTNGSGVPYPCSGIAIDPTNTQMVVVTYQGFNGRAQANRTKHVFETTDGGQTWNDISGTDGGDPTQNLPDVPVSDVVIDPGTTPHGIIIATDAAVLRSGNNGATWQVLGAGFPTVLASSLQIDSSASPALLRVGTYGRSNFELKAGTGLSVNSNLAFGVVPIGGKTTSIVQIFNVGSSDIHMSSFSRVFGSTDFTIISGPPPPVTINPGEEIDYTVQFAPTSGGPETAQFQIKSDDPNTPTWTIAASGTGGGPVMTVSGDLNFGTVARGTTATKTVTVYDSGYAPLTIDTAAFESGSDPSFSVLGPTTPQTIHPGDQVSFTVQFAPPATSNGALRTGTLDVGGYDALYSAVRVPVQTVGASGTPGVPAATLGSTALQFGSVPVDERTTPYYADKSLTISNQSSCPLCDLHLTGLSGLAGTDFQIVSPPTLPATIAAGNSLTLTVRFDPTAGGDRTATLTVTTDDPANPTMTVSLDGQGLLPSINPSPAPPTGLIFGPTVYDPQCGPTPGCGATQNETITNNGQAELILDQLVFGGSSAFSGPGPTSPLTRVQPSNSFLEAVTFHPTGGPARKVTGTLHVEDDVLTGPVIATSPDIPLCGESVGRGIRVLVKNTSGAIVPTVSKLSLQSHGLTKPVNINLSNLPLTTIDPPTSCQRIQFQYENQNLQAVGIATQPGSYYTLTATVGNRHTNTSFTLNVNEFKQITLVVQ